MTVHPDISFTRVPLSDLSSALLQELGDKIASKHHLEGAWTRDVTGHPIFAMSLDSIADSKVGSMVLRMLRRGGHPDFSVVGYLSAYSTPYGHMGTLTVAIASASEPKMMAVARFCAPIQSMREFFTSSWCAEVILFRNQRPILRLKATIPSKGELQFTPSKSVWLEDTSAAYWSVLSTDSGGWHLTAEDHLRIGWVQCLNERCQRLMYDIMQFVMMEREHLPVLSPERDTPERDIPALSRIWEELVWIRDNSPGRFSPGEFASMFAEKRVLDRLLHVVDDVIIRHGLLRVLRDSEEIHKQYLHLSYAWFSPIWWATFVYTTLPKHTDCGLRLAYLWPDPSDNTSGNLRYHNIDAKGIARIIAPEEWWPRIAQPTNISHVKESYFYLAADAVPATPASVHKALEQIVVPDPQGCLEATMELVTEALICQEWTIPPGAVVEIQFGPFTRLQLWQDGDRIRVIAWTKQNEFWFAVFNIKTCIWDKVFSEYERLDIESAWRLLLASIVRDFMVVEQRERVWQTRQQQRLRGLRPIEGRGDKIIVYIPRVRYLTKAPEHSVILQGIHDLDLKRRAQFAVRAHLRRVTREAAEAQQVLATKYGFVLPEGYTFVRPHMRGGLDHRERVYRSRSALACFYQAEMIGDVGHTVEWFQFERDCKRLLEMRGLTVEHVAASRSGDHGTDLYASAADTGQLYAVQCKCYNPRHLVGPAVIRELVGSLTHYPEGTIGMLITTSDLTSGAKEEAERNGILWINGTAFAHTIQQKQFHR